MKYIIMIVTATILIISLGGYTVSQKDMVKATELCTKKRGVYNYYVSPGLLVVRCYSGKIYRIK